MDVSTPRSVHTHTTPHETTPRRKHNNSIPNGQIPCMHYACVSPRTDSRSHSPSEDDSSSNNNAFFPGCADYPGESRSRSPSEESDGSGYSRDKDVHALFSGARHNRYGDCVCVCVCVF
jgi:hypothetical protein